MSALKTAVFRQIAYAKSVRSVIRSIMRRMLDGEWINRIFASSDDEFNNRLDMALKSLDLVNATKRDFCGAVVDVLCDEVSDLCLALKEVCEGSGYSDYYESHISHDRFVRLVLSVDTVKLGKMKKILEDAKLSPIDVLRNIGAVLNDETLEERSALGARARRHANAELRSIAKATMKAIDAVGEKVDAVGEKVDAIAATVKRVKRRGKYDDDTIAFCVAVLSAAENNATIKSGLNTRVTHDAVFDYNRRELEMRGVSDVAEFTRIIRAHQAREQRKRGKAMEARTAAQAKPKNGIIYGMKRHAKSALALTLAIAGGFAAPLRSDASVRKDLTPPRSGVTLSAASAAPRSALPEPARAEVRGRVVKVADGRKPETPERLTVDALI